MIVSVVSWPKRRQMLAGIQKEKSDAISVSAGPRIRNQRFRGQTNYALRTAARAAGRSLYKYRVGAVILRGTRVLSYGHNKVKTHPASTNPWRMVHAELDALYKLDKAQLEGATICVVRLSSAGLASSKPCPHCREAIEEAGLGRVIYVDLDGDIIEERILTPPR
jgi:deoxycytidylate deaminase